MYHSLENGLPQEALIRLEQIEIQTISNSLITYSPKKEMNGEIELMTTYTKFSGGYIDQMTDGPGL